MGLEKHINRVLKDAGEGDLLWKWNHGLIVRDGVDAKLIMEILDESGEFGPSNYNIHTGKIEFGVYNDEERHNKDGEPLTGGPKLKPKCELIGKDGNVFAIIGTVQKVLKKATMPEQAKEFGAKALKLHSYDEVLQLVMEYVEVE